MHPVVAILNEHGVEGLKEHGIKVRWSTLHPEKFSANYDQLAARDSDPISQECRGLVLAQVSGGTERGGPGRYEVVAQPFRRFFNHGQGSAAELDWGTVRFEEKLDGTLCIVYWYWGQWCVATRNIPDADVMNEGGMSFGDLFWQTIRQSDHTEELALLTAHDADGQASNGDFTFCFELTTPKNRVHIPYTESKLTLLASFHTESGQEVLSGAWGKVRRPIRYDLTSLADALQWVHAQPGNVLEGVIAIDAQGRRQKMKNSRYLALIRVLTASGSDEGIVELLLNGAEDDVLPFVTEERRDRIFALREAVRTWAADLDNFVRLCHNVPLPDRKTVAIATQNSDLKGWIGTVLDVWSGKAPNTLGWVRSKRSDKGGISKSLVEKVTRAVVKS